MSESSEYIKIDDEVIDNHDAPHTVVHPVLESVNFFEGEKEYNESLARFSKEQRYVVAMTWYEFEVSNGGHSQFYYNSSGILWKDVLSGFKELGLDELVEIINESIVRIGEEPSLDRETRISQLEKSEPNFDDLDSRFYKLDNKMYEAIHKYIFERRNAFYFDGEIQKRK